MNRADQYIPQTGSLRLPVAMWLFVAALSLLFLGLILAAPLAAVSGHDTVSTTIYLSFRYLCHQLPERSFYIAGHQFAVCARCTGLYSGFAAAVLFYPVLKSLRQTETPARKWLFLAAAPLVVDWSYEFFGFGHNTYSSRFITGALLGAVAVLFIMPGLIDLSLRLKGSRSPALGNKPVDLPQTFPVAASDYSAPHRRI